MSGADCFSAYRSRSDAALLQYLPDDESVATNLVEAMRYSVTNGGKRIRPALTYATGYALGLRPEQLDIPANAIELMHAYSLVHDDLPAMDDDDLRRGKPTCHKQFDEATAILAGDALQALAFSLLAENPDTSLSANAKLAMIRLLGQASGAKGMAAGQAIDLASVGQVLTLPQLEDMHRHKTGALIHASIMMAPLAAGMDCNETEVWTADAASEQAQEMSDEIPTRLGQFAREIGLAFQIVDDILDVVSDTETLGKTQGADDALNKPTYPALLGLEGSRRHAADTYARALKQLDGLGPEFDELRQISDFIINRSH